MNENQKYSSDDIQRMAAVARRDQLAGIYRAEAEQSEGCTCGWRLVVNRRQMGWSGTWCRACAVADEMYQAERRRIQLYKANKEIERLRALIVRWNNSCKDEVSLDEHAAACLAMRMEVEG